MARTGNRVEERKLVPSKKSHPNTKKSWLWRSKLPEVATAALIGSVVAVIFSPISHSLTYYLSQFLSKPIMSIEYVETIPTEKTILVDGSLLLSLIQSPGYLNYVIQRPAAQVAFYGGAITLDQARRLRSVLEFIAADLHKKLKQIQTVTRDLETEIDSLKIKTIVQGYAGPLFNSFAFANEPPEAMKTTFYEQIRTEAITATELLGVVEKIQESIDKAKLPIANMHFKISILNRGDTDGLIRSTGKLEFSGSNNSIPLLRITAPKLAPRTDNSVQVTVTNQTEVIRESSVGKIEKHSMVEFWFAVDESALPSSQRESLISLVPLIQESKFRIILTDQEKSPISFTASAH